MTKKERNSRLELALLLSLIVFGINGSAMLITYFILFVLARLGVFAVTEGRIGVLDVTVFIFFSSMIIGFILSNSMGKIPLKPFNRLITQLNRLASGDFSARLHFGKPINSHPVFQEIETSFNMAAEELEHTEMLRNDFINSFSHEFRTPIASISGFCKLLRREDLSPGEREEYLSIIEEESLRLSQMASNVLTLSRIENQTILKDITKFNLSEEIRASVLLLVEKWSEKDLLMDLNFQEYMIEGNSELLKQVWINLLDNAIKFSNNGGTVTIGITEKDDLISVSVSNGGKEIPPEALSHIYNKFYQVDKSHSGEGNGIGLAIAKKVLSLHNGKIEAISSSGLTTFTVTLPVNQDNNLKS